MSANKDNNYFASSGVGAPTMAFTFELDLCKPSLLIANPNSSILSSLFCIYLSVLTIRSLLNVYISITFRTVSYDAVDIIAGQMPVEILAVERGQLYKQ